MTRCIFTLSIFYNLLFLYQPVQASTKPLTFDTLTLATYSEHINAFNDALIDKKCPDLNKFNAKDNQVLLEFYLFCNALKIAGLDLNYKFIDYPLMERILIENQKGNVDLIGFGLWTSSINKTLNYISTPILEKGEFVKGLYTTEFNDKLINSTSEDQIKQLIAVTNEHWDLDNEALNCLGIKQIYRLGYKEMYGAIHKGQADFVLKSFTQETSFASELFGYRLKPIQGFKVTINDELRFIIHKKMPNAEYLLEKLNIGLAVLKNAGLINKHYENSGLINKSIKKWTGLGCKE